MKHLFLARSIRFNTLQSLSDVESLTQEWLALLADAQDPNTFLTPSWLLSWWTAYRPNARLHVVTARLNNELVGIAPVMLSRERRFGIAVKCLRFLGDGTHETDHMNFVVRRDTADELCDLLLEEVAREPWDVAEFSNVPEHCALSRALARWRQEDSVYLSTEFEPCPLRVIPASFDELLAAMPSRFRTAIRSTRRKLADAHKVEFGLHTDPSEFDAALEVLYANHESRWKARGQNGVFVNDRRRQFYKLLTRRLYTDGDLRFFFLKLDGQIVAQEYCFQYKGTVYLLQEGFDYALSSANVGNALRSYVFQYLIDNRYKAYDFLAGISRHKTNWSDVVTNDVTFTVCRRNLRGRIAHFGPLALAAAKDVVRPIRDALRSKGDRPQRTNDPGTT